MSIRNTMAAFIRACRQPSLFCISGSLFVSLLASGCGGQPAKVEVKKVGQWDAIVGRPLPQKEVPDSPVDGHLETLDFNVHQATEFPQLKKLLAEQTAQIFYYSGHSNTTNPLTDEQIRQQEFDPTPALVWGGILMDKSYTAGDLPDIKSTYKLIFMNCCWSTNGDEVTKWYNKLSPKKDASGVTNKMPAVYIGWPGGVGKGLAADYAIRFFQKANDGLTVNQCYGDAMDESKDKAGHLWQSGVPPFKGLTFPDPQVFPADLSQKMTLKK